MKKKLLHLLFFLASIAIHGQTKYGILVKTDFYPFVGWYGSHGGTHTINIGNKTISKNNSKVEVPAEYNFLYVTDPIPSKIFCKGQTAGNYDGKNCKVNNTIEYNPDTFYSFSFRGCIASSSIMGIYLGQPYESNACKEDVITLKGGWNWKYSYDGKSWDDFPNQYQAKRTISFKLTDLKGWEGKLNIYFKTGYNSNFTDKIIYDIIPCSPKIESISDKNFTSCIYSKDGNLDIQFDRDLAKNESFLFNFYTTDNALIHNPPVSYDKNTRKYTFSGLAQGDYYLKYQTFIGEQQASINEKPYPKFTISPPSQFKFDIIEIQPTCYKEQGIIKIQASGGTPPYYYSINNGATIPFENPLTSYQNINKPDGIYSIKVTDNKGCIEK